ncbi:hypothetical protein [Celeribacter sp.]|uniref:hypothetical protein n=1 Tax=Celeribacter sp. TaxID=1890673 RepID=UPI003A93F09E
MEVRSQTPQDQQERGLEQDGSARQPMQQGLQQGMTRQDGRTAQDQQAAFAEVLGQALSAQPLATARAAEDALEELVTLAPMVASPLSVPVPAVAAAQNAPHPSASAQAVQVAMEGLEAKQSVPTADLGGLRFSLGTEIAGLREATLSMTTSAITVTLHSAAGANPAEIAAVARDMAAQMQLRHPDKTVRVVSDREEEEVRGEAEFDPFRGPVTGSRGAR